MFRKGISIVKSFFRKREPKSSPSIFSKSDLRFTDVLKNSYANTEQQKGFGKDQGYVFDDELSSGNQQVYYNPNNKKLLLSVAGTRNLNDVGTDVKLLFGGIKDTKRYKEASNVLDSAKNKYGVDNALLIGDSLGGSIVSKLGGNKDKIYSYNKGQTFGDTTGSNESAYRSGGDLVSFLGSGSGIKTIGSGSVLNNGLRDYLDAHKIANIQDEPIFV